MQGQLVKTWEKLCDAESFYSDTSVIFVLATWGPILFNSFIKLIPLTCLNNKARKSLSISNPQMWLFLSKS